METLVAFGFAGIVVASLVFFYYGSGRSCTVLIVFILWALLSGALSCAGFFQDTQSMPPRMAFILLPSVLIAVWAFRRLRSKALNVSYLFALHALRLPVELVLYSLFVRGLVPQLMTFEGYNVDIVTGLSALLFLVHGLWKRVPANRNLLVAWNIAGLALLLLIVALAVLSEPSPFQQLAFRQPNLALLSCPFTLLPAVVVPLVFLAHALVLRQLFSAEPLPTE